MNFALRETRRNGRKGRREKKLGAESMGRKRIRGRSCESSK